MLITKESLKLEIDTLQEEYLEILYRIIRAFVTTTPAPTLDSGKDWEQFIQSTYGCLKDAPITRGAQGAYEYREAIK